MNKRDLARSIRCTGVPASTSSLAHPLLLVHPLLRPFTLDRISLLKCLHLNFNQTILLQWKYQVNNLFVFPWLQKKDFCTSCSNRNKTVISVLQIYNCNKQSICANTDIALRKLISETSWNKICKTSYTSSLCYNLKNIWHKECASWNREHSSFVLPNPGWWWVVGWARKVEFVLFAGNRVFFLFGVRLIRLTAIKRFTVRILNKSSLHMFSN